MGTLGQLKSSGFSTFFGAFFFKLRLCLWHFFHFFYFLLLLFDLLFYFFLLFYNGTLLLSSKGLLKVISHFEVIGSKVLPFIWTSGMTRPSNLKLYFLRKGLLIFHLLLFLFLLLNHQHCSFLFYIWQQHFLLTGALEEERATEMPVFFTTHLCIFLKFSSFFWKTHFFDFFNTKKTHLLLLPKS